MFSTKCVSTLLVVVLLLPVSAMAQRPDGELWRAFAQKLDVGAQLVVRLQNGQRFRATLIDARADALVVQPRSRRPVPVQAVSYDAIASLERDTSHGGPGKAIVIGIAAGVGAFFAILGILAATID